MKIQRIRIKNFRSFKEFSLDLAGGSRFLIAECAVGKTTFLTAVHRALGRDRNSFTKLDFGDSAETIEIELVLDDFDEAQRAMLVNRLDFPDGGPPSLTTGVRVTWDTTDETAIAEHGYPSKGWSRSTPDEREALLVQWLPAERDVGRYLQFGFRRNLIARLVDRLEIEDSVRSTSTQIKAVVDALGNNAPIEELLDRSRNELSRLIPGVSKEVFELASAPSGDTEILRLFGLLVSYHSDPVPVAQQSSGLGQLAIFSFLIQLARSEPGTVLLIDQPEISLHPHPQRSLARLLGSLRCQWLIATHSSNLLDRADPRRVIRFRRGAAGVEWAQPTAVSDASAQRFARYTTPQTAEAFFARAVILVEGLSDVYALVALAERHGRNLDGEGITVVSMEGAGGIQTFLALLGPKGFGLRLAGLCDADKQIEWAKALAEAGIISRPDESSMQESGFCVCNVDLEDELIRAYGAPNVINLIREEGEGNAFRLFAAEQKHKSKPPGEQLRAFFGRKARKVRYAPLIVERLDVSRIPLPLVEVLKHA